MRTLSILLFALLLTPLVPSTVLAGQACEKSATMPEARALALKAADHLAEVGPQAAFHAFIDPNGPFIRDDLYVFVFRRDGLMLLNVAFPELIGSNVFGGDLGGGWPAAHDAMRLTKDDGSGWIEYNWFNPCSGQNGPKRSYVVGRGNLIIGVGAYGNLLAV